jgi:hypothetical protein
VAIVGYVEQEFIEDLVLYPTMEDWNDGIEVKLLIPGNPGNLQQKL